MNALSDQSDSAPMITMACPRCGDAGFINPTSGLWQCGNAGCDFTDEIDLRRAAFDEREQ